MAWRRQFDEDYYDFGALNNVVMLLIASTKATLVILCQKKPDPRQSTSAAWPSGRA